ncbi:MAG: hypothetical protein KGZ30_03920, partial [Anaplasmataceae bacterium]|nr:hypothetical protein [Anaplasmataceae bacterium]
LTIINSIVLMQYNAVYDRRFWVYSQTVGRKNGHFYVCIFLIPTGSSRRLDCRRFSGSLLCLGQWEGRQREKCHFLSQLFGYTPTAFTQLKCEVIYCVWYYTGVSQGKQMGINTNHCGLV